MNALVSKRRQVMPRLTGIAVAAAMGLSLTQAGNAQAADKISLEEVVITIPVSVGGGMDRWTRFNAPFLSKYLPGEPKIVVDNVSGGGGTTGANQFVSRAKPDGSSVFGSPSSTQFAYLLGDKRVKFDSRKLRVFMATGSGGVVYVKPDLGVKSAADIGKLRDAKLVYAAQRATSLDLVPLLAFDLLNIDVRAVMGFKGRGDGRLAFERGETNIDYQTTAGVLSNVMPMVEAGEAVPLFSWGSIDANGDMVRDANFPDLPSFKEFYTKAMGKEPSGPAWDAWKAFFISGFAAQRMMFLPEGTSDGVLETYREAARKLLKDKEFLEKKGDIIGNYEQVTDKGADRLFDMATVVPDEARAWVIDWLQKKYDVKL